MKVNRIWEGKLPSYWDITPWFHSYHNWIAICYRDNINNRVLEIKSLESSELTIAKSFSNVILGNYKDQLVLARVSDARSHILLERLTSINIMNREIVWSIKEKFLLEKNKIPYTCSEGPSEISLGNKRVNICNGKILTQSIINKAWFIDNGLNLHQDRENLVCRGVEEKKWEKEKLHGSWLHGYNSQYLYFLTPKNNVIVLNKEDGKQIVNIEINNIRKVSGRVGGLFTKLNLLSHDSTTIYDILINNNLIVWINDSNQLVIMNFNKKTQVYYEVFGTQREVYLLKITKDKIFVLENIDDEFGRILCISEGLENGKSLNKK